MQLLLTDRLTCPRCGPTFGLILLANQMQERRVMDGVLGCPNCRDSFPVDDGFADLRAPPRGQLGAGSAGDRPDVPPDAERIVAMLGIPRGPGTVAFVGRPAVYARGFTTSVPDADAVVVDADTSEWPEVERVSRIVSAPGLPFFDRVLRGVVVDGGLDRALLYDAARVTAPMSRVVVLGAGTDAGEVLVEAGLTVLAREGENLVAARG